MIFQLGVFVEAEVIIDLRSVGLLVTLADGPNGEAQLKMASDARRFYPPVVVGAGVRTYNLTPIIPGSEVDGIYIWGWLAHYYWAPPKSGPSIRRGEFTLARTDKRSYRIEFSTWQTQTIQYVPDNATAKAMEDAFQATRLG